MEGFKAWFTPERRQQIQAFVVTLVPLMIMVGWGNNASWEQWLLIIGALLGAAGSALSLFNLNPSEWATQGWSIVRGIIYGLGTVIAPALLALGYINVDTNAKILTGLSLGITALSSAVSIFANGQQQKVAAVKTVMGITPETDPGTIRFEDDGK